MDSLIYLYKSSYQYPVNNDISIRNVCYFAWMLSICHFVYVVFGEYAEESFLA